MRTMMIGIGTATVLLGLVLVGVQLYGQRPRTTQEAISMVLRQHGFAFEDIRLVNGRCLPTPEQCSEYRADVVVVAEQPRHGLMQCWETDQKCELWLPDLGLDTLLPKPIPPPAWLERIERLAHDAAAWVKMRIRN